MSLPLLFGDDACADQMDDRCSRCPAGLLSYPLCRHNIEN